MMGTDDNSTIKNPLHFDKRTCKGCEMDMTFHVDGFTDCPARGYPYSLLCPAWETVSVLKVKDEETTNE